MVRKNDVVNDYYPTPPHATFALVEAERGHIDRHLAVGGSYVWEPAAGRGWMSEELMRLGYPVISTDLVAYDGQRVPVLQHDFLTTELEAAAIVTNPPYGRGLAEAFARRALERTGYVAMLCRATWVESAQRYKFFTDHPPSRVLFFSRRFSCTEDYFGTGKEDGGMVPYAWWVWDTNRAGARTIDWIDPLVYQRWKESVDA
jgi:hypothetical protein